MSGKSSSKDPYEILGVDRNATQEEIHDAFRKKAKETHPDVNNSPDAEKEMAELNEAYRVLRDSTPSVNNNFYSRGSEFNSHSNQRSTPQSTEDFYESYDESDGFNSDPSSKSRNDKISPIFKKIKENIKNPSILNYAQNKEFDSIFDSFSRDVSDFVFSQDNLQELINKLGKDGSINKQINGKNISDNDSIKSILGVLLSVCIEKSEDKVLHLNIGRLYYYPASECLALNNLFYKLTNKKIIATGGAFGDYTGSYAKNALIIFERVDPIGPSIGSHLGFHAKDSTFLGGNRIGEYAAEYATDCLFCLGEGGKAGWYAKNTILNFLQYNGVYDLFYKAENCTVRVEKAELSINKEHGPNIKVEREGKKEKPSKYYSK